jgi:RNA polymerase sigma factor (TIGR02999 family)
MSDVIQVMDSASNGDPRAAAELLPLVYDELRKLAAARLADERSGQSLDATALVHEAYVRLVGSGERPQDWNGRGHFFAAAAEAMRRILVDNARRKRSKKRGGDCVRLDLDKIDVAALDRNRDVLDIDAAIEGLTEADPVAAQLVKLRYFVGLTIPQAAEALGISPRNADFLWAYARAWLLRSLGGADGKSSFE